jgi:signal peptidase I
MLPKRSSAFAVVLFSILVCWLAVFLLRQSVFDLARVTNVSMEPRLKPGSWLLVSKLSPCLKVPFSRVVFACTPCEPGEVYVFRHPENPGQKLVKLARPFSGDIIWFTGEAAEKGKTMRESEACYFEGANREHSIDSRHFGPVPFAQIEGRVIWPMVNENEHYDRR